MKAAFLFWKLLSSKLIRMLPFIRATKDDFLTLSVNILHNVRWWVDASYAVHPDMKSHTGGAMSLGKGVIYGTSKRQKLNTKSSTELELVGTDDVMPQILWTLYFLKAQGYEINDNVLNQDNKSSILLESLQTKTVQYCTIIWRYSTEGAHKMQTSRREKFMKKRRNSWLMLCSMMLRMKTTKWTYSISYANASLRTVSRLARRTFSWLMVKIKDTGVRPFRPATVSTADGSQCNGSYWILGSQLTCT
jgi:hypothetical protein